MHIPLSLDVAGRRVVVVGDGEAARRRAAALSEAGAIVDAVPAGAYRSDVLDGAWLVVTAAVPAVNAAVFADAEVAGVWCNSADDTAHCSYLFPSVLRRGGVTVAVSTGGQSPALAAWLRRELEDAVGPEFAEVALRLAEERRRIHAEGGSTEGRDWTARIEEHRRRVQAGVPSSSKR